MTTSLPVGSRTLLAIGRFGNWSSKLQQAAKDQKGKVVFIGLQSMRYFGKVFGQQPEEGRQLIW